MQIHLIITVISDDRPGLVETIAHAISQNSGNWLESRLSHLGGKFAGVVRVQIPTDKKQALSDSLNSLEGIRSIINPAPGSHEGSSIPLKTFHFSAVGPDRQGIVREISHSFAAADINVEELNTNLSSMPYSGEPIFEARGVITVPASFKLDSLQEKLDELANNLAMDINLHQPQDDDF